MNNISGFITKAILENCAHWFLYIFIDPKAKLSKKIMAKRANQVQLLQAIDKIALFNNYQDLVNYVESGIRKKYNLSPVQVLSMIYNINAEKVAGIGSPTYTGSHFDGASGTWVDDVTGAALPEAEQAASTQLANQLSAGSTSNFWTGFKSVIEWIVKIITALGLTSKQGVFTNSTPDAGEWADPDLYKQEAGMGGTIPYIVGGVILYYLFTKTKK